jgi:hypothetical protein
MGFDSSQKHRGLPLYLLFEKKLVEFFFWFVFLELDLVMSKVSTSPKKRCVRVRTHVSLEAYLPGATPD